MEFQVNELGVASSSQLERLSEREPTTSPSHQDGLMFDLGTRNGVDLEAAEQGFGVKRSGFRPKWLRRGGACAPGAVRSYGGSGNCLHTWVVDGRLGGGGVRGEERALRWPYLRAVRHSSGEPLRDAVDTLRVV